MNPGSVFVTGCYRSGTTLLEKALSSFPGVFVGHQPITSLYLGTKVRFLEQRGAPSELPLGPLFPESGYAPETLLEFLSSFDVADLPPAAKDTLRDALGPAARGLAVAGSFQAFRHRAAEAVARTHGREGPQWSGEKEIVCEEFVPYLLERGVLVFLVVRDPRDVVRSAHLGNARAYIGRNRPVLFTLRQWRKSVAFALRFRDTENFAVVRFEDLLDDAERTLERITGHLRIGTVAARDLARLPDQHGRRWEPNSSHPDGARPPLPGGLERFIETVCAPEMRAMGYARASTDPRGIDIASFREPWPVTHRLFRERPPDLAAELAMEKARLEDLERPTPSNPGFFVFGQATHADLKRATAT